MGKLAEAGHEVVIINRDIKPGGLVEYGIYFNKHKLKEGVRIQFRKILADPRVHYLGHIKIGAQADLTLDELREVLNPPPSSSRAARRARKLSASPETRRRASTTPRTWSTTSTDCPNSEGAISRSASAWRSSAWAT